jgi:hypothetical protein
MKTSSPVNRFYVYELIDPRNNQPFYVGKGSGRRAWTHYNSALQNRACNMRLLEYILDLISENCKPIVRLVEEQLSDEDAYEKEIALIKQYRLTDDISIVNRLVEKRGPQLTDESKKKISQANFGQKNNMWGRKHRPESIKMMSENHHKCDGLSNDNAKHYTIIDPQGGVHVVSGRIAPWCKERGFDYSTLLKSHKLGRPVPSGRSAGWWVKEIVRK